MGNEQTVKSESHLEQVKGLHINTKSIQNLSFSKPTTPVSVISRHFRNTHVLFNSTPVVNMSPVTPHSTPVSDELTPKMSTRRLLSYRVIELSLNFWIKNIDTLSMKQRLEIGCSIFRSTPAQILEKHFKTCTKLETVSLKFLDMIGFTVRTVGVHTENASVLLHQLGKLHQSMNIDISCYAAMLQQTHQVFGFYFPRAYTEAVRFAFDEVFTYCTQLMTGKDINILNPLNDIQFMQTLRICVASKVGREYLFRYLHQAWCDEMVFFIQLLSRYKTESDDKMRFLIAENINRFCIKPKGVFSLNVSYELRQKVMQVMSACSGSVDNDIFVDVETEIYRLIVQTHWHKFKQGLLDLYVKE